MVQLLIVAGAFALLPLLTGKFKLKISLAVMISAGVIHLAALRSPQALWEVIKSVAALKNLNAVVSIVLIGVLSGLMKQYGLLDDIVESSKRLIRSRRALIGMVPAMIGLLSVPGGAYLSAPFVNDLGEEMGIPAPRRAAINLTFRHTSMFLSPLSNFQVYIASCLPGFTYALIGLFVPFVAVIVAGSVLLYMPRKKDLPAAPAKQRIDKSVWLRLLRGLSPILLVLLLNGAANIPMSAALLFSLLLVYLLGDKKDFARLALKNVKLDVALMILAVYFAQYTVMALGDMQALILNAFVGHGTLVMMLVVAAGSLFLGFITGLYYLSMGIFLPILPTIAQGAGMLPLLFFVAVWAYMGYYYSPLHLCQMLTLRHMNVTQGQVYKEHIRLALVLAVLSVALYFLYALIF